MQVDLYNGHKTGGWLVNLVSGYMNHALFHLLLREFSEILGLIIARVLFLLRIQTRLDDIAIIVCFTWNIFAGLH